MHRRTNYRAMTLAILAVLAALIIVAFAVGVDIPTGNWDTSKGWF